jgi:TP901 family phage tail tape measure protein
VASAYAIETVFKLIDRVSAPTSKIGKELDKLGIKSKAVSNALKRDFDKAANRIDRLGASIKKWGGRAILGSVAAIGLGIGIVTKQFIEFDSQLYKAGSIFSDLNPLANDFKTRLDAIGKAARGVAAPTEFNAEQTARALATMAMAGIKSEQAISLLPKVADMATAAGVDLDNAVGMAADSLNIFGKMTDDPIKLAKNFQYVSDIMVKTANIANMDITAMYNAVAAGGGQFKKANQRIEDFGAAVDILAANGIKGSEAGTKINTIMTRLSAPVTAGQEAIKKLGIRTKDAQGNLLNFVDVIEQLKRALSGMGDAQQAEYIKALFGQQQLTAVSALINAGVEGFRVYAEQLEQAAGSTQTAAEAMRQSIKNKLAVLGSAATEMGFKFIEAFQGKAVSAIETLTGAIENFDVTPLVNIASAAADGITKFAGALIGAVKTAWQFRYVIAAILVPIAAYNIALMGITLITGLFNKIMAIKNTIVAIATGFHIAYGSVIQGNTTATASLAFFTDKARIATAAWMVIMKAATLVQKSFLKVVNAVRNGTLLSAIAQGIQAAVTGVATAAQWALNAALTANPIGVVIMAIAALITIIVLLAKNWNKVTAAVKEHTNKFLAVLTIITAPIGFIISMIKEIASNWGKIKDALAATGLFDKIKEIGAGIKDFIGSKIEWLVSLWNKVRNAVGGFFSYMINGVKSFFEPLISKIVDIRNRISGFFKGIFDAVYNFIKPALDFFVEKWQQIVSFFKDNAIVNAIKVIGGTLLSGILAPVQGLLEILSYIPGLGHLAGKGAEKIEEFRNFLKGVDGATVSAEVNVPGSVAAALTPPTDTGAPVLPYDIPGFGIPGMPDFGSATSAGGRSKLHGVVDISGGAIPSINGGGSYTATSALNSASPPVGETLITRTAIEIAAILRRIDAGVSLISRSLPVSAWAELPSITAPETATRTSLVSPRVNMGGDNGGDYYNPRNIPPITQYERMAYSLKERRQTIVIEVAAEKGTAARIVRAPRDVDIQLVRSGGNS